MKKKPPIPKFIRARSAMDDWDRSWRRHWSKVGLPGYELGFGRITDSPKEAVDLILRSLPGAVRDRLSRRRTDRKFPLPS